MAKQFLKRAQIGTARQQMGRETVAQGMGRERVGEPEAGARGAHRTAHQIGVERSAIDPDEHARIAADRPRDLRQIRLDRLPHGWDDRDNAGLVALSGDPQRGPQRKHTRGQRQRFGDAQPRSVEQEQNGKVARADPWPTRPRCGVVGQRDRVFGRSRTRQGARPARRAGAR